MAARSGQKIKLFYIADILKKYTDEEHPIPANVICDMLAELGISAERKAIYNDIEQLMDYGFDIVKTRVPKVGYFLGSRQFELPEIYLLADAVRTAKFITPKKSRELVSKLQDMLSVYQTTSIENGIYIDSESKCTNEEIFYNIDTISRAIKDKKKITFIYRVRTLGPDRTIKFETKQRTISPYALTWQDDHYYLIGNYEKYDNLVHFRIDRMRSVDETDKAWRHFSEVCEYKEIFDVADYTKRLFSMQGGKKENVDLKCNREILEQITDRFGDRIFVRDVTDTHFTFTAKSVIVSDGLVTWLMNYGDKITVLNPPYLVEKIKKRASDILSLY